MIFNTNVLPNNTESNDGFFRRFLLIHFDQTIPEDERDPMLAGFIVENELSGVFNWVLSGLKRLLSQKGFSPCPSIDNALKEYKKNSDSVNLFLEDAQYVKSTDSTISLKVLYSSYKDFCKDTGYQSCSVKSFSERLKTNNGVVVERKSSGRVAYLTKVV